MIETRKSSFRRRPPDKNHVAACWVLASSLVTVSPNPNAHTFLNPTPRTRPSRKSQGLHRTSFDSTNPFKPTLTLKNLPFKDLYKEIIIRNPKKVGSSGLRYGLGLRFSVKGLLGPARRAGKLQSPKPSNSQHEAPNRDSLNTTVKP